MNNKCSKETQNKEESTLLILLMKQVTLNQLFWTLREFTRKLLEKNWTLPCLLKINKYYYLSLRQQNGVDGDEQELDEISNESHDEYSNGT